MASKCIYCSRFFNPLKGQGDHVLASGLFGEFEGDSTFRGICTRCITRWANMSSCSLRQRHSVSTGKLFARIWEGEIVAAFVANAEQVARPHLGIRWLFTAIRLLSNHRL